MTAQDVPSARTDRALDEVTDAILRAAFALQDEGYGPEHAADLVAIAVKRGLSLLILAEEDR